MENKIKYYNKLNKIIILPRPYSESLQRPMRGLHQVGRYTSLTLRYENILIDIGNLKQLTRSSSTEKAAIVWTKRSMAYKYCHGNHVVVKACIRVHQRFLWNNEQRCSMNQGKIPLKLPFQHLLQLLLFIDRLFKLYVSVRLQVRVCCQSVKYHDNL